MLDIFCLHFCFPIQNSTELLELCSLQYYCACAFNVVWASPRHFMRHHIRARIRLLLTHTITMLFKYEIKIITMLITQDIKKRTAQKSKQK